MIKNATNPTIEYSLPNGVMDIKIYDSAKEITIQFIDELNTKGFLKLYVTKEEDTLTRKVTERVNTEAESIVKLEKLFHEEKYQPFLDDVAKHGFLLNDIMNYYMGLFAHQMLDCFESFRKYLVIVLDKDKIGLRGNPALGTIFKNLENKKVKHRFYEIINMELRNALGHGWYWWQNSNFYYTVDPKLLEIKTLTLGELYVITRKTALLLNAFNSTAFQRIIEIKNQT